MTNEEKPVRFKKLKTQLLIFLVLFIVAEIGLRLFGMKAGTIIDDFGIEDNPQYLPRFISDEMGINHIYPNSEMLMLGTVVNQQGFRGNFNYTKSTIDSIRKYTGRKIVMIIGDSYVEGCCADTVTNSFPDLIAAGPQYEVLNFGVAGTDPLQYELIAKKYVKELKPDIVVVAVYFGNDLLTFVRYPNPGAPLTFPFKKNKWIYGIPPSHLSKKENYAFKTAQEAYDFYMRNYTLRGENRNWFQKTVSYSVIISKLYLLLEHTRKRHEWEKMNEGRIFETENITYNNIKHIQTTCDSLNVPLIFAGIPSPAEAAEGNQLLTKYKQNFKEIPFYVPQNLTKEDYDGTGVANHFNNIGHKKYADFLVPLLSKKTVNAIAK